MKKSLPEYLEKEIHPTKNGFNVSSSADLTSTAQTIWWLGLCGHEWSSRIAHRLKGVGCPYCAGQKILPGFNDLNTTHSQLVKEWDYLKNNLSPLEISSGSSRYIHWKCSKNHEWEAPVKRRTLSKTGCPYCAGQKILPGFNDLATLYPEIVAEWNIQKNNFSPHNISPNSTEKIWWKCEKNHEWRTAINLRTSGSNCPICMVAVTSKRRKTPKLGKSLQDLYPQTSKEWSLNLNVLAPSQVNSKTTDKFWWVCEKNHEWEARVSDRTYHNSGCPQCASTSYSSKGEKEIADFIRTFFPSLIVNTRNVIPGNFELDMFLPELNVAVEFNGLYWHSEAAGKGKYYHYNKWLACKEKGIQLIQIWEDDWKRNPELIKQSLKTKLNVSSLTKIYARNTTLISLSQSEVDEFLNLNHIQGSVAGSIRIGLTVKLEEKETLVAVMVLKKEANSDGRSLNLLRYATSEQVVGGFTKILNQVKNIYHPNSIVTFSDNTISNGGLYNNNGFQLESFLPPDYMYVVANQRTHKFNYRLKRFKTDSNLFFDEKLSERELAIANNISRIWDAGKIKWILKFA